MHKPIKQLLALLLLLLFIEKAGLRLWIHLHYHEHSTAESYNASSSKNQASFQKIGCDCVDDFFVPFTGGYAYVSIVTPIEWISIKFIRPVNFTVNLSPFLFQFRGPPAAV